MSEADTHTPRIILILGAVLLNVALALFTMWMSPWCAQYLNQTTLVEGLAQLPMIWGWGLLALAFVPQVVAILVYPPTPFHVVGGLLAAYGLVRLAGVQRRRRAFTILTIIALMNLATVHAFFASMSV